MHLPHDDEQLREHDPQLVYARGGGEELGTIQRQDLGGARHGQVGGGYRRTDRGHGGTILHPGEVEEG